MFLKNLRQLHVFFIGGQVRKAHFEYRCKNCPGMAKVIVTESQYNDLRDGIPFVSVFSKEEIETLQHFKRGICHVCWKRIETGSSSTESNNSESINPESTNPESE